MGSKINFYKKASFAITDRRNKTTIYYLDDFILRFFLIIASNVTGSSSSEKLARANVILLGKDDYKYNKTFNSSLIRSLSKKRDQTVRIPQLPIDKEMAACCSHMRKITIIAEEISRFGPQCFKNKPPTVSQWNNISTACQSFHQERTSYDDMDLVNKKSRSPVWMTLKLCRLWLYLYENLQANSVPVESKFFDRQQSISRGIIKKIKRNGKIFVTLDLIHLKYNTATTTRGVAALRKNLTDKKIPWVALVLRQHPRTINISKKRKKRFISHQDSPPKANLNTAYTKIKRLEFLLLMLP